MSDWECDERCDTCPSLCADEKVKRELMTPWQTGDPNDFEECREEGFPDCSGHCETCKAYEKLKK